MVEFLEFGDRLAHRGFLLFEGGQILRIIAPGAAGVDFFDVVLNHLAIHEDLANESVEGLQTVHAESLASLRNKKTPLGWGGVFLVLEIFGFIERPNSQRAEQGG